MSARNLRNINPVLITIAFLFLNLSGCTKTSHTQNTDTFELMSPSINFQFAIYFLHKPAKNPDALIDSFISSGKYHLKRTAEVPKEVNEPLLNTRILNDVQKEYAPPSLDALARFGRGISREQALALQNSSQVLIVNFAHPKSSVWDSLRTAYEITEAIARETDGLLWDEETREIYSPDEWHKRHLDRWTEKFPVISDHIVIHAYKSGEFVRAITLGMIKFGLPDAVIEDMSWSVNRPAGNLINSFCQSIAEYDGTGISKQYDLKLDDIKNNQEREQQLKDIKTNAETIAKLTLKPGKWEEGDPANRLIEITFDRNEGNDKHARLDKALSTLYGWEDSVVPVRNNDELLEASQQARKKLPDLKKLFDAGLQPGEYIEVKGPFSVPTGGTEWMWVEITSWNGNKIKGMLKNEPVNVPFLHGGQIVEVDQEKVFDYIKRTPDGKQEGNTTGAIIQKMQQGK